MRKEGRRKRTCGKDIGIGRECIRIGKEQLLCRAWQGREKQGPWQDGGRDKVKQ